MNTSHVAHEPEPVRLDPLQGDIETLYAEKIAGDLAPNVVLGTTSALVELGLENSRVGFDNLRLAQHANGIDRPASRRRPRRVARHPQGEDPQEIDFLRHGAALNEAGLRDIMPCIRPGVVWKDIAAQFRNFVQARGANLISAQKALQFGAEYGGEYFPDLMFAANDWKVRDGQVIIFETWGTYSNYAFDVSRTVHVGEPTAEYRRICATISAAQQEAVQCLRAGISTHDAWAAMSKLAYAMPVPTPRKTLVFLHSIGLDIIELPSSYPAFGRLKNFDLEVNTVINFEYLYFGHSVAPYHLESSYLIAQDGAECLHTLPQELTVLV